MTISADGAADPDETTPHRQASCDGMQEEAVLGPADHGPS